MFYPIATNDMAQMMPRQTGSTVIPNMTPQIPALNQPPVQMPQLTQLPAFLPNPRGYSPAAPGMPYIRNNVLGNVLGPLTQPNYGIPPIMNPYGNQPMPIMNGGGLGQIGFPGGQWGIQPIRGSVA